uniref:Uncharacterized protein n=1 Tax=Arundo donax TaxID=35708 RepID=A0A0A9HPM0_ARUDO
MLVTRNSNFYSPAADESLKTIDDTNNLRAQGVFGIKL